MNRNEYEGQTILILGSGPSINDFNCDDLHRYTTIGINQISRRIDPDIITLLDSPEHMGEGMPYTLRSLLRAEVLVASEYRDKWESYRELSSVTNREFPPMVHIEFFPEHDWRKWQIDDYQEAVASWPDKGPPKTLPFGYTSLSVACWLAAFLGASRIGLVGMDHGPEYFFESVKPHAMNGDLTFDHAQHHLDQLCSMVYNLTGTVIYNLSKRSKITTVPSADLQRWIGADSE